MTAAARLRGADDERSSRRRQTVLFRAATVVLADHRLVRAVADGLRRGVLVQRLRRRSLVRSGRFPVAAHHDVRLVRERHRRIGASPLQPEGRPLLPLGHELVHLFRGHVLRRLLRRAVLRPQSVGARPGQPAIEAPVARLRTRLADGRTVPGPQVHADGGDRHSAAEYDHPGQLGWNADDRASRAEGRASGRSRPGCS